MAYVERVPNRPKREVHYTVVPRSELDMLHQMASGEDAKRVREGQEERERLKEQSAERVKHWPNTIEAMRLKKESDRKDRMDAEEAVRRKRDEQDARVQAEMRKEAIERANMILYEQDDKVKSFHSKMQLSHVLEERHKQIALKQQMKERETQKEREWDVLLHQQMRAAKVEEDRRKAKVRNGALSVQKMQKEQLLDAKVRFAQERKQSRREGEAIRAAAEQAVLVEIDEEVEKKDRARNLAETYAKANDELKLTRAEQARQEEAENMKIQRFAQLKEQQMMERKRRADEKFHRDLERRQALIERQSQHLQKLHSEAEERTARHMAELEKAQEVREIQDREKREKLQREIDQSRQRQLQTKERRKRQTHDEESAFRGHWEQTADVLLKEEHEGRVKSLAKNRRLQEFQKMQQREKETRAKAEKESEKIEGEMMKRAMAEEGELFKKYVDSVTTEYAAKGLDLNTLKSIRRRDEIEF